MISKMILVIMTCSTLYAEYLSVLKPTYEHWFPSNTSFIEKNLIINDEFHKKLKKELNLPIPNQFTVITGLGDNTIEGFIVVDKIKHYYQDVIFLTHLSDEGFLENCHLYAPPTSVSQSVPNELIMNQFLGKSVNDTVQLDKIDIISGATVTSQSYSVAVKRALAVGQFYIHHYIAKGRL